MKSTLLFRKLKNLAQKRKYIPKHLRLVHEIQSALERACNNQQNKLMKLLEEGMWKPSTLQEMQERKQWYQEYLSIQNKVTKPL